jgi:fimbrial chaperone protein
MGRRIVSASCLGLAALVAAASPVLAGSIAVSPVRLDLSARQPVTVVKVRNDGTEPSVVQLDIVSWAQDATEDVYGATSELLATPPIFTVPAGGSQVVRVGLRRGPDAERELTYRLFLQEIPPAAEPGFQGMRMALRIGVPVFVAPNAKAKQELRWRAVMAAGGGIKVSLANSGTEHVKIADLQLAMVDGGHASQVQRVSTYVLPGQSREWLVKMDGPLAAGSMIRLKAHTDPHAELAAKLTLAGT